MAIGALVLTGSARASTNLSVWACPSSTGRLLYKADYLGNRILDTSGVGYKSGLVPLPTSNTIPVKVTISPVGGDNTANIQTAINQVSAMPLSNGFRGAVLLSAGTYPCASTIKISASGVVLRGVGSFTNGTGTVIEATASNQYSLIQITGSGSASTVSGTTHTITNLYVPVGARSFYADSVSGLAVGDHVFVRRVATSNWIHDIGMDLLTNPWTPDGYMIDMDRVITHLEGSRVFVDAPITCAIDRTYTNGTIRKYTWSGRISNSGVEHIYCKSDYFGNTTNENHGWIAVQFNTIENGWARDVISQFFGYSCVALYSGAKFVTVQDCQCLDPISIITGGRRYAFVMDDDTMCLVKNCYTRQDRHQYVTQSLTTGPNMFVDSYSDSAHAEAGPHHRWATGPFWDNITVNGNNLDAQNTCEYGTGHGWEGANCVIWNSKANGLAVASPPGARNWLIGSIGTVSDGSPCHGIAPGPGTYDSSGPSGSGGANVFPNSLYFAQMQDRLAVPGLQTRDYWIGDIDGFTNSSPTGESVPLDNAWRTSVQSIAAGQPLDGFDIVTNAHWVPFTFNFTIGAAERVVAATLTMSMRATNSASGDVLYLDSLTNSYTFSTLGWLPISTNPDGSNATVRVLDLTPQLNLLTNGQLNVAAQGDIGIDWAMLELQVAPVSNAGVQSLAPAADATVRAGTYASSNFGSTNTLSVKSDSTTDNIRQAYLRWDLSSITQTVFQARVSLTPINVGTNAIEQGVRVATSNTWTESGITWNNQPGGGERFANWIPGTNASVSFDVTPQVLDALAGDKQLSLELFSVRNVGGAGLVDYASREYSDANSRPQLLISLLGSPPVISAITNRTIAVNASTGPISFAIGDADSPVSNLVVTGTSDNDALVPDANIVFNGNGSNLTVTITPLANQSGSAGITITVADAGALSASTAFTLTVSSHAPAVIVWNGPGAGANNWSASGNWLPAELPEALDDVKFYNPGATGVVISNVNNFVDAGFTVASLQYANTNGNHTTAIASGATLNIIGANALVTGTETDNGSTQTVFATITGVGGSLTVSNAGADIIVRQGSATNSSQRATLDLSGLGMFTAGLNQILVGTVGPVNRATGTLYLGRTNEVTVTGSPGILAGDNNSNNGGQHFIYLGQENWIFADSITIARQKATATLRFNPAYPNSTAVFRASDGESRVSNWNIADHLLQSNSSSSSLGTNDFSGGSVDALVDTLLIGRSQKTTGANSTGVLTFTSGTIDANTVQLGFQAQSGATSAGIGRMNVNGSGAVLVVNTTLELGHTSGGGGTTNTFGVLSINGGAVYVNSIIAGGNSGPNALNINGGALLVTNTIGSLALPISTITLSNANLQIYPTGNVTNFCATILITAGANNLIAIQSLPNISSFPAQFRVIQYTGTIGGSGYNFTLAPLPAGALGYLSNNVAAASVDLVITNFAVPDPFLTWNGNISADWDVETANWKNNITTGIIYDDGNDVVFNDSAVGPTTTINVTDIFSPDSVTVSNTVKTYAFTGIGGLTGPMQMLKQGGGKFVLASSNYTYTGNTVINGGTLALSNVASTSSSANITLATGATLDVSGRTDGTLTLSAGQTLMGNGTVLGSVAVSANATLEPGASIGALTVTNDVTLAGTTFMELDRTAHTNDVLRGAASISYGGTLTLTNLTGPLLAGDSFRLFYAAVYNGAFASIVPPMPGSGLAWDISTLTNGALRIIAAPRPRINSIAQSGANFIMSGSNGIPNGSYFVLTSTNVSAPLSTWARVTTNFFTPAGTFSFTYAVDTSARHFFAIQLP
jgi:autotransporter-associated beta strand protein